MKLRGKAKARARRKALERREEVVSVRFTKRMYDPLPPDADPQFTAIWEAVHPILIAKGNPYAPTEPGAESEEG
jgi:hypothetical protein